MVLLMKSNEMHGPSGTPSEADKASKQKAKRLIEIQRTMGRLNGFLTATSIKCEHRIRVGKQSIHAGDVNHTFFLRSLQPYQL
jgi:hypothetical protein